MQRIKIEPRQNWTKEVEALGFDFYKTDGVPYWTENAYYSFTSAEIDMFEAAANEVHGLCVKVIDRIIDERLYQLLSIPAKTGELIAESWKRHDPAIYGRFDFMYDGVTPPKLLEYNADTPSSLFEASIVQWNWREQVMPKADQFNSIHEHLVERWKKMMLGRWVDDGRGQNVANQLVVTTAAPHPEDECTTQYMGATATEAGFKVQYMPIQELGWNGTDYTDMSEKAIRQIFKLYPWEWLMKEQSDNILATVDKMTWFEPMWKMFLSNKGILPILWDTFPNHENLLPAYRQSAQFGNDRYVAKPMLGREGANITIQEGSKIIAASDGDYGNAGYIYQGFAEGAEFDGNRPNLGIWMVNDESCGMGVREDSGLIVSNGSRFVPHIFE